jgi:microcystin-dependent protein
MYEKTNWKARRGTGLNKFTETERSGTARDENTVILTNTPDSISEPGTPFNEDNMNHIEQGIEDAHSSIIDTLNNAKDYTDLTARALNAVIDGIQALTLSGAFLTRVVGGFTRVALNLFEPSTGFIINKTLIGDANGTIGVCTDIEDRATIIVQTLTIAPISTREPTLLGNVLSNANLPLTIEDAVQSGWNTPRVDDYAKVLRDETLEDKTVEWYIADITDGAIIWGNPVIINAGDYQGQTTAQDAGRVLTGGRSAGTFGESLAIDSEPTEGSNNLITSNAVSALMKQVFLLSHPVGSIYFTVSTDENTKEKMIAKYGGNWEAWGQGRVPVGVDTTSDFNAIEKTGGEKTNSAQMPSHNHGGSHSHSMNYAYKNVLTTTGVMPSYLALISVREICNPQDAVGVISTNEASGHSSEGSGNSHNNLQPYITCYMYKRIAEIPGQVPPEELPQAPPEVVLEVKTGVKGVQVGGIAVGDKFALLQATISDTKDNKIKIYSSDYFILGAGHSYNLVSPVAVPGTWKVTNIGNDGGNFSCQQRRENIILARIA